MTDQPAAYSGVLVALVGHCLPDTSYLKMSVLAALPGVTVTSVLTQEQLDKAIAAGALLLVNRALEPGFSTENGLELMRGIKASQAGARLMLISNFPESQAEALAMGALPGFGKRELGTPRVKELLKQAAMATV